MANYVCMYVKREAPTTPMRYNSLLLWEEKFERLYLTKEAKTIFNLDGLAVIVSRDLHQPNQIDSII